MTNSMHFLILSICYIAFLNFLFWHKQHINTPELNIFGYLLIWLDWFWNYCAYMVACILIWMEFLIFYSIDYIYYI